VALAVLVAVIVAGAAVYAAFALQSPSCQQSTSSGNLAFSGSAIKIGYLTELSGSGEADGYSARIGAELAVNESNAAGGVDGKSISLVDLDTQTNTQIACQQAAVLDQRDGVLAITGPTDPNDAIAISGYAETHGVPFVASNVPSAELSAPGLNWTVSVEPDAVQWGATVAKYVSVVVPGPKIALMTQNANVQNEMAAGVRWYADTYRNESVVFDQVYSNAQFPWATAAAAAKFSGANAVVVSWLPTVGFAEANVIEALLSAGFLQSQIFVVSATDQVSDLGTNATGIRGATLFDQGITSGYPNASAFVSKVEPFITGQANPHIAECAPCQKTVGDTYFFGYLGMKLMINAIQNVLSSGQVLTREDFMSSIRHAAVPDLLGNTLKVDGTSNPQGNYYLVVVGQLNATETNYDVKLIKSAGFAPGTVPVYEIAKTA